MSSTLRATNGERAAADMTATDSAIAHVLLTYEIEQFLYREAEMLDERRFEDWLAMLTDDVRYWVPMRRNVKLGDTEREFTREGRETAWIDEGRETLARRVAQLQTGMHWAEEPLSRISHMVSNVQILEATPSAEAPREVKVKSRFLIYRNRVATETDFLVGKREDVLRKVDGLWKIARRKVILDQSVLLAKNLTIFF